MQSIRDHGFSLFDTEDMSKVKLVEQTKPVHSLTAEKHEQCERKFLITMPSNRWGRLPIQTFDQYLHLQCYQIAAEATPTQDPHLEIRPFQMVGIDELHIHDFGRPGLFKPGEIFVRQEVLRASNVEPNAKLRNSFLPGRCNRFWIESTVKTWQKHRLADGPKRPLMSATIISQQRFLSLYICMDLRYKFGESAIFSTSFVKYTVFDSVSY